MKVEHGEIVVLDCGEIHGFFEEVQDNPSFIEFAEKLGEAMSGIGFVYLVNHGVDSKLVEDIYAKSRDFFELPQEVKSKYKKKNPVENFHGYTGPDEEIVTENQRYQGTDRKETWDYWGVQAMDKANFPSEIPGFKSAFDSCRAVLIELSKKILRAFAVYLKLDDPDFFIKRHRALNDQRISTPTNLRSNYYMPLRDGEECPKDAMRLTEHMDWSTCSLLFQDSCGGLEAKKINGDWIPVTPIKDSIVLNAGLMLEIWSGGHLPATPHRVRLVPEHAYKLRQSVPFFLHPDGDVNCTPVVPEKLT